MSIVRLVVFFLFCIFSFSEAKSQYIVKIYVIDESTRPDTYIENAIVLIDNKEKLRTGTDGMLVHLLPSGKHIIKVSRRFYETVEFEVKQASTCVVTLKKTNSKGESGFMIDTYDDNISISRRWYRPWSEADSLYELGEKYYKISIETEDKVEEINSYNLAIHFFEEAAELNHQDALLKLYEYYNEQNSSEKAIQCLQKASDLGNTQAIYYLGNYYTECEKYSLAFELYNKGADLDDIDCQMKLAEMYEKGLGVEKDIDKAMKWYKMATGVNDDASTQLSITTSTKPLPVLPQQKRIALLIGNSDYQTGRLLCVGKDVKDMKAKLEELGFETMYCPNVELMEFLQDISSFCKKAREGEYDAMLFYFAGHGIQCQGENYLVPIGDFYDDDILVKKMYVGMNDVLNETAKTGVKTRIFILDACREQPVAFTRSISKGLVGLGNTPGVFMAYSTMAGKTAKDNGGDGNSPYIKELLEELNVPQRPINDVFENVKRRVSQKTGGKQQPSHVNDLDVSNDEIIYLNRNNK